ncbi:MULTISPECIES: ATP-dependent DNA helicase RecG [Dietzia]|uniref:ATP-dependent DNA helicase RecG n=1 Tax=Dietzia cinnamea TaxID=321318 RepID=A0AAW5Q779_9ACTN|nr:MULTISPECIES: ATP-dependent DNA helicase RecG [Dietzia]PWD94977.1 ATP-dependent DNA helicase RecG [Dietzia maris]MBM7229876.1 ATP-dependent DNA helicase RecG [Dietzia cinnamea]MCT1641022.1 ATP-dependent DNA helicase RecG [Dietzia cinnamea]MCT1864101.1 ATP-dependent DNA helicase RecG [Dietzia cinnamea]MCT2030255.1 ATP-dependent DNA helicase RecG [Dietzia cinnamea]
MTTLATTDTPLVEVLDPGLAERITTAFGHRTVGDLLHTLPRRYRQHGQRYDKRQLVDGERVTVIGTVTTARTRTYHTKKGQPREMLTLTVEDGDTEFRVVFFAGRSIKYLLPVGTLAMFDGTVSHFRRAPDLKHPEFLVLRPASGQGGQLKGSGDLAALARLAAEIDAEGGPSLFDRPLLPVYAAKEGVTSWDLLGAVVTALRALVPVVDPLDDTVRSAAGLMGLDEALRKAHLPENAREKDHAGHRLRFDEALALQLLLGARRRFLARDPAPASPVRDDGIRAAMGARMPFELTDGQKAVLEEISADLARDEPMNRLLQGEVGSGKTVVALLAMLQVLDAGRQCVMLAPTEVLAVQHHRSLTAMLGDLGERGRLGAADEATRVVLLTGSMSTAQRRAALLDIVTGEAGIVVGTHALIQDSVDFFDLGLVVVDEQHRFGVRQRDRLRSKGRAGMVPHLLVMTATPIPRTIAMTVFGDLEVSELEELPGGRRPISTSVVPARERPAWLVRAWERVREEVAAGHRAYVVCSRIDADDGRSDDGTKGDDDEGGDRPPLVAAVDLHEYLSTGPLAGLRIGLLHGRLPSAEKDATMADFAAGRLDVLVSTTVIEVGVDVPEATVMVVMDAERFGVSQLHQLRGRVGRGGLPGLCLLVTNSRAGSRSMERLDAVAATTDGFVLAHLDLVQRREGDVLGDAQSGALSALRLLSVVDDGDVIEIARRHAEEILEADPGLHRHPALAERVRRLAGSEESDYLFRY